MKETISTSGILLKKTWLANDDAVLDVFTAEKGRVSVFASKLARSKKRQLELDFFRLLDLELTPSRTAYKLHSVSTKRWFGGVQADYELSSHCFQVFENFRKILPEEKPLPDFFSLSEEILSNVTSSDGDLWLSFWEVKALIASGLCPRFDLVRSDMWWQFETFECFDQPIEHSVAVPNEVRQLLEFLRRSDLSAIKDKKDQLPPDLASEALQILQKVSEYH